MNDAAECAKTGRPASGARTLSATVPAMREPLPAARRMAAVRLIAKISDFEFRISDWSIRNPEPAIRNSDTKRSSGLQFCENLSGGFHGVGRFEDRAADDDEVRAGVRGVGGSHDARLIIGFDIAWTNAGRDEDDVTRKGEAKRRDFERRADQAAQAGPGSKLTELHDLFF